MKSKKSNHVTRIINIISITVIMAGLFSIFIWGVARYKRYNNPPKPSTEYRGRVLVIAVRASGGHISAAKAIQSKLAEDQCIADIIYLDDYDPMKIGKFYDSALRTSLGRIFINLIGAKVYWSSARRYFTNLSDLLPIWFLEGQYDCIVSVMPFTYKLVNLSLKEFGIKIPFIIVPTDFEDPQIGCGYWIDGPNAKYLLGSDRLFEQASKLPNKSRISGFIIKQEFIEDIKSKRERRLELNLPLDKKIILVLFGSCGTGDMLTIAKIVQKDSKNHYIFVCGKDKYLFESLNRFNKKYNCGYTIYGFADNVHKLMQAADIFIGKPGPGCINECIATKLPMIFRNSADILLQERYNMQYVFENGLGISILKWEQIITAINSILENEAQYNTAFENIQTNNALAEVCNVIKNNINRN